MAAILAGFPPHTLVLPLFLPDKTREFEVKKLRSSGRHFQKQRLVNEPTAAFVVKRLGILRLRHRRTRLPRSYTKGNHGNFPDVIMASPFYLVA